MVKVRIKATKDDIAQADNDQGDFKVPPPGVYTLVVKECNSGFSKGSDGEVDKSKPRLEVIYGITGIGPEDRKPEETYGQIWDYVSFSDSSGWKRANFLKAFGHKPNAKGEYDLSVDTDDFINRKVIARLKHEAGRNKEEGPRAKVARLIQFGTASSSNGDTTEPDYGSDVGEEPDDSPFGDENNSEENTTTSYTVDDLEAMSLKELGALYKEEFNGDPKDCIVKKNGKTDNEETKEAIVNAILEAQGDDEDGSDDDDDDPF